MKRAKVTFFMIAYNEEKWIQRAIRSVLEQTEPEVELYVRNNGSTDRTGEIVRGIAAQDSRVHLVENKVNWRRDEAGELPFTNEKGIVDIWPINQETLGDYVSFLDADDRLQPTFAAELLQAAQGSRAEIAACGNVFMQDGETPVENRLPPSLQLKRKAEWGPALRDFKTFEQLYNVFRTYWGKLFRRDFFLRYYDKAWISIGGRYNSFLDTVTMMRYLQNCERLVCVAKPLYLFTLSGGSTYAGFSLTSSPSRVLQAEALFEAGRDFLQSVQALTKENSQFLYQLNWAFCWESIEGFQRTAEAAPEAGLERVITMLNNRAAQAYAAQSSADICRQIEPVLHCAWMRSGQNLQLYLRYPIRLMYVRKLAQADPASSLLPVLVMGVLNDVENQNLLGWDLLPLLEKNSPAVRRSLRFGTGVDLSIRHNSLYNWWAEQICVLSGEKEETELLVQQMKTAFAQERYEEASERLSKLSEKNPLHKEGICYRILMAELIGEHELAVVLAASARVLFGLDVGVQQLCWSIFAQEEEDA